MPIDVAAPLHLRTLEDHLWASADLFRGLTDVEVQRDYVLALLFFKRASDIHKEETAAAFQELGDAPDVEAIIAANADAFYSLRVPEDAAWADVVATDRHELGTALNDALAAIAAANPRQLASVFEYTDFNNRKALPPEHLAAVVRHFDELGPLTRERVPPDMLGQAYEWLIAKFAAEAGKAGGEFYTPAPVGLLGARLLQPPAAATAYDPTCGSGGLLLELRDEAFRLHGDEAQGLTLYGQELKPTTWAIGRMNMLLHGANAAATIEQGDTLFKPAFVQNGRVRQFDLIIANPPFSSKNWGHDKLKSGGDPFGRMRHLPPKRHGEMAFVQHMVASLKDHGRMAVVLPNGALFRAGNEQAVRRDLVEADLVEAVIQLPKDMFYGAGIPACYLLLNKAKRPERVGRVLFIDGAEGFARANTKNVLQPEDIDRLVAAFNDDNPQPGISSWVSPKDIAARRFNLTVRRYVQGTEDDEQAVTLPQAIAELREAQAAARATDASVEQLLSSLESSDG
ncbi:putative type I restriction enzymeP M protein [Baekduia alba]|uniref:N-6 DNA methylase n=1 Tax=Baekduia alba TaxID=2997333 RepID=UPI0023420510|nr:N-6 DNA methylase [Baekduia alba]WCB92451.1 putative type I restriction enzymeP M protein [Baekduia alba]